MIPGHPASPNAQGEGGKTKRIHTFKTCFFKKLLLEQNPFLALSPRLLPGPGSASAQRRLVARAGAGGRAAEPLSPVRLGCAGVAPHCQALAVTAIRARRGNLWRLTDYRVERTTWKCVPPPSISSSSWNPSSSRASFRRAQGRGKGFRSKNDEAAVITCARAMANYRANAPTNPCLRSRIPLPSHGDSKNGPLLPSAGPTWGGVRGAGVTGRGSPSFAPPRGRPMIARNRGPSGYC